MRLKDLMAELNWTRNWTQLPTELRRCVFECSFDVKTRRLHLKNKNSLRNSFEYSYISSFELIPPKMKCYNIKLIPKKHVIWRFKNELITVRHRKWISMLCSLPSPLQCPIKRNNRAFLLLWREISCVFFWFISKYFRN